MAVEGNDLWDDLTPEFIRAPSYVSTLRADIANGTFIVLKATEQSPEVLCRILKFTQAAPSPNQQLVVNIYRPLSTYNGRLPILQLDEICLNDVCEVIQTPDRQSYANIDNLFKFEIAFVFNASQIRSGIAGSCQGIRNVFVCRFRAYNDVVEPIEVAPYPSLVNSYSELYDSCYASRVWTSMMFLHEILMKGLNRYSERQGEFSTFSARLPGFPHESWAYIIRQTGGAVQPIVGTSRRLRQRHLKGFKSETLRITNQSTLLRFETEIQLERFRIIFGSLSTFGIRRRRARIGFPNYLRENDTLNVIIGSLEEVQQFDRRTTKNGIDLTFDSIELKITIRYERYIYTKSETGAPLLCQSEHLAQLLANGTTNNNTDEAEEAANHSIIVLGAMFEHNTLVLKVCTVRADYIVAEYVSNIPAGQSERVSFNDKDYVAARILEYN